jgi:uncharacterized membrane protein
LARREHRAAVAEKKHHGPSVPGLPKQRLDAMSDAIFAVAMTLLALELKIPHGLPLSAVPGALDEVLPRFATYLLTFAFIGIIWIYLQHFQQMLLRYDLVTITISLMAAGGIILLPFTSSTAAAYGASPHAQRLFAFNFAGIVFLYGVNTLYSIWRDVPAVVDRRLMGAFAWVVWICCGYLGVGVPILVSYRPTWGIPAVAALVVIAYVLMWIMHPHFANAYRAIREDGQES